jgi:hypothetical protein
MKILAIEKDIASAASGDHAQALKAEALRVWCLYQEGAVREAYFRQDRHAAVLVLECADAAQAHDVLDTLPLVQAGLIKFEVIPLIPYPGFARLFAS